MAFLKLEYQWITLRYSVWLETGLFLRFHSHKTSCSSASFKHKLKEKSNKQTDSYTAESDLHLSWITQKFERPLETRAETKAFSPADVAQLDWLLSVNTNHTEPLMETIWRLQKSCIRQRTHGGRLCLVSSEPSADLTGGVCWGGVNLGQAALGTPSGLKTSRSKIWTHQANQSWPHVKGRHAFCHGN